MAEIYRAGMHDHALRDTTDEVPKPVSPGTAASVLYLVENIDRVPMLLVPTIGRRYGSITTFQQASQRGSILPAVWSFMLALHSRGLGSAWTTLHLYREEEMAALLGIPEGHTQVGMFPVAYTMAPTSRPPIAARPQRPWGGTASRGELLLSRPGPGAPARRQAWGNFRQVASY